MSLFIKLATSILMFVCAASTWAAPFTVVDQASGASYQCGAGGSSGGTAGNPQCVQELTDFCYSNTSNNRDQCFQMISNNRGCGLAGYAPCVLQTQQYCYTNTSMNRNQCFEQALGSCRGGNFSQPLLDAVAAHAQKNAELKFQKELNALKKESEVNPR